MLQYAYFDFWAKNKINGQVSLNRHTWDTWKPPNNNKNEQTMCSMYGVLINPYL